MVLPVKIVTECLRHVLLTSGSSHDANTRHCRSMMTLVACTLPPTGGVPFYAINTPRRRPLFAAMPSHAYHYHIESPPLAIGAVADMPPPPPHYRRPLPRHTLARLLLPRYRHYAYAAAAMSPLLITPRLRRSRRNTTHTRIRSRVEEPHCHYAYATPDYASDDITTDYVSPLRHTPPTGRDISHCVRARGGQVCGFPPSHVTPAVIYWLPAQENVTFLPRRYR